MKQKPTEPTIDRMCFTCRFRTNESQEQVVPHSLVAVTKFKCCRYPKPEMKEINEWCGEWRERV
jgi:hypothetical protein